MSRGVNLIRAGFGNSKMSFIIDLEAFRIMPWNFASFSRQAALRISFLLTGICSPIRFVSDSIVDHHNTLRYPGTYPLPLFKDFTVQKRCSVPLSSQSLYCVSAKEQCGGDLSQLTIFNVGDIYVFLFGKMIFEICLTIHFRQA